MTDGHCPGTFPLCVVSRQEDAMWRLGSVTLTQRKRFQQNDSRFEYRDSNHPGSCSHLSIEFFHQNYILLMLGSNYDTTVRRTKYQAILKDARGWTTTGRSDGAADAQGGGNVRERVRLSKYVHACVSQCTERRSAAGGTEGNRRAPDAPVRDAKRHSRDKGCETFAALNRRRGAGNVATD